MSLLKCYNCNNYLIDNATIIEDNLHFWCFKCINSNNTIILDRFHRNNVLPNDKFLFGYSNYVVPNFVKLFINNECDYTYLTCPICTDILIDSPVCMHDGYIYHEECILKLIFHSNFESNCIKKSIIKTNNFI